MLERQRIARTLHDNFLQSVQALIMQFSVIKGSLPRDHPAQQRIDAALDAADDVMIEGRDQVLDLRVRHGQPGQLEAALRDVGHRLAERHPADFALAVEGTAKPLKPAVSSEALAIAREAIVNAFQHAHGDRVQVHLRYGRRQFELSVRDNGRGINAEVMGQGHRPGHWGLTGMRERAEDIGATCKVDSAAGKGTTVILRIASRRAYVGSSLR